jgi:hypothetical protein
MGKKDLQNKVIIKGEFTFLPGYFLEDKDGINLEEVISEKLSDAGYDVDQSFNYKIIIEYKK